MTPTQTFSARLHSLRLLEQRLCVGVDPHPEILERWGLPDTAAGAKRFGDIIVENCVEQGISLLKPQVAFFERYGVAGMKALSELIGEARAKSLLVICDAKRGDVGSTVAGYASAWLAPGSDFESDAMTAVAFQGVGSLTPVFEAALAHGRGVFVLVNTSNPEGWPIQGAMVDNFHTVAQRVYSDLVDYHTRSDQTGWLGAVVGATLAPHERSVELSDELWLLAPGFGHQGAKISSIDTLFSKVANRVLPTVSRSVTGEGEDRVGALIAQHLGECSR